MQRSNQDLKQKIIKNMNSFVGPTLRKMFLKNTKKNMGPRYIKNDT